MVRVKNSDFVFGISDTDIRRILGDAHGNKFETVESQTEFSLITKLITPEIVGGVKSLLDNYGHKVRQFVAYGLRYFIEDNKVYYAVHLKTKTHPISGELTGRLSLGVGEHLTLDVHRRVGIKNTYLGEELELMAEASIFDQGEYFTTSSRLIHGIDDHPVRLGFVMATKDDELDKTNRHVGVVMASKVIRMNGERPNFSAKDPDEHFVGWFTMEELMVLDTPEGANNIIYRHNGFEPWTSLIIERLRFVSKRLRRSHEQK